MQRQFSVPAEANQHFDFDFDGNIEHSSLLDDDLYRMRLDSEYVWEGGEDMYEDIVASTQPTMYLQPTQRKAADNFYFHQPPPFLDDVGSEVDYHEEIEMPSPRFEQQEECSGCRRNHENEEEFGLDSTFVSC